jgi:sulfatase modifying factor 1
MRGTEGRLFPWGAAAPDCSYANFATSATTTCVPIDDDVLDERRYAAGLTPLGIADGAGNVAEWVADFYAPRSSLDSVTLVTGPPSGTQHVTKGGSFVDFPPQLRGAARFAYDPDGTGPNVAVVPAAINLGVRCAYTR